MRTLLIAAMQEPATSDPDRTRLDLMIERMAQRLESADAQAIEFIGKRVWPAPMQVEVSGDITVTRDDADLADLVEQALAGRAVRRAHANGTSGSDTPSEPGSEVQH